MSRLVDLSLWFVLNYSLSLSFEFVCCGVACLGCYDTPIGSATCDCGFAFVGLFEC